MSRPAGGSVLVNSEDFDVLFSELCSYLDSCSSNNDGCENCPLCQDCRAAYDTLANNVSHYKLTPEALQEFKTKYRGLSKQLSF